MKKKFILIFCVIVVLFGAIKIRDILIKKKIVNEIATEFMKIDGFKDKKAYEYFKMGEDAFLKTIKLDKDPKTGKYKNLLPENEKRKLQKKARYYLEKSLKINPNNLKCHENLAFLLKTLKEYKNALLEYKKAFELGMPEIDYFSSIFPLYRDIGDKINEKKYKNKYIDLAKKSEDEGHVERFIFLLLVEKRYKEVKKQIERVKKISALKNNFLLYKAEMYIKKIEEKKDNQTLK